VKKNLTILFALIGINQHLLCAQQTARLTYQNNPVGYLEYLPPGYATAPGNFPLLIFLHGGGQSGDGTPASLEKVKSWGPPYLIDGGVDMCFTVNGTEQCFIVISPQLNANESTWALTVSQIIDHVFNGPDDYRVDADRIYVTGMSRGGLGAYQYAASLFNNPNKIAAIAPIAAWSEGPIGCIISERKISVWAFHGILDTVVPYSLGWSAFSNIQLCTNPQPVAELKFTTYEDRYHDSWIPAYDPGSVIESPNLYEWLLLQERQEPDPVTGLAEGAISAFAVYPNPARDRISIHYRETPGARSTIGIYNPEGACMMAGEYDTREEIDISDLPSGIYIVRAAVGAGMFAAQRFIK